MRDPLETTTAHRPSTGGQAQGHDLLPVEANLQRLNFNNPVALACWEVVEGAAGMARYAMATGNFDEVLAAWEHSQQMREEVVFATRPLDETPLGDILPTRLANLLEGLGVRLVGEALALSFEEFTSVPNAGRKGWELLHRCIGKARQRRILARRMTQRYQQWWNAEQEWIDAELQRLAAQEALSTEETEDA